MNEERLAEIKESINTKYLSSYVNETTILELIQALRAERRKVSELQVVIKEQEAKNTEFANITDEYVENGYKLADAVEQVEIENNKLIKELQIERQKVIALEEEVSKLEYKLNNR